MSSPELRAARVEDAPEMVALVRAGFEPSVLGAFIYGCPGIVPYVASLVRDRALGADSAFFVAVDDGRVVGMIELRILAESLFLNYVAIHPEHRTRRLGSALLRHAIDAVGGGSHATLSLDVLDGNVPAKCWYESLGMNASSTCRWWAVPLAPGEAAEAVVVTGLPQARVCQAAFGFSRFNARTPIATYDVGMLGESWFRITDARGPTDRALAAALDRIDPRRRLLLLTSHEIPAGAEFQLIAATHRMTGVLSTIRENLAAKVGP